MPRDCQKLTSQRNQTTSYMKDTGCFNGTNIYTYCGSIKMTTEVSPIGEGGGDPELSPHVHDRYIYIRLQNQRYRFQTSTTIASNIHDHNVRNRLNDAGIHAQRPHATLSCSTSPMELSKISTVMDACNF